MPWLTVSPRNALPTHRAAAESYTQSIQTDDRFANVGIVIAKQLRCETVNLYKSYLFSLSKHLGKSHHSEFMNMLGLLQKAGTLTKKNRKCPEHTTLRVASPGEFHTCSKHCGQISVKTFFVFDIDMISHITHPSFAPAWSGASCAQERTGCLGCASTLLHAAFRTLLPRGRLYPGRCQN